MTMTNYPAESAPSFLEVWDESPRKALRLTLTALGMMTWKPWVWARGHATAVDLPGAWWIACHVEG